MRHRRLPRIDLAGHTYFITCNVHDRTPLLGDARLAQLLLDSYTAAQQEKAIALHAYVVMPDHYHVLFTLREMLSMSSVLRDIHSPFVRKVHALGMHPYRLWQKRPFDHVIRDEKDFFEHIDYIHDNPVKAGLVENITDYYWSSAVFWETGEGPIPCVGLWWE